ncbi:monofunctional biosynthetic peptidoglycan transglycosylase [Flavihumibacter petaseus]|uniref:monofunctional biosynthetic peptidoglycan transglycosylase n=1 Tax=Flavihumibacter petaseus TaxID=549295 RepID=UPI000A7B0077|nr:monofunctional biosynthetic peptidoglycan transglycosylase [Flavihumibacter petaseus]
MIPRTWRFLKKFFLILFVAQLLYIILLRWVDPPFTFTQLGDWFRGYGLKRDYVDRSEMSRNIRLAVISSEDQLFADHSGFDWKSIEKAMDYNKRKPNRVHGASTISQQTAKNVFLWQGRSWIRKAMETYFTFMIEHIWGKKRILEVYLNVIEMGPGVFGIEAASRHYFHKSAANLSRAEASRIAACLPNPKKFFASPASKYVLYRSVVIQKQMTILAADPDIQKIIN